MSVFILLTRIATGAVHDRKTLEELERRVMDGIHHECRGVTWLSSLAILGPYDYLDIFDAPDVETATKVALIVRLQGGAHTEVWPAMEWSRFVALARELPAPQPHSDRSPMWVTPIRGQPDQG